MKNIKRKGLNISQDEMRILKKVDSQRNGAFINIVFETDCKDRILACHRNKYNVTKTISMSVRKGIDYEKMKRIIEKRKAGIQKSNMSMWYHHIDKTLVKHNNKDQYYILCMPNGKPHVRYKLNGKTIDKNKLKEMEIMQPSFWNNSNPPECMTIKLDNIIDVYSSNRH